ncbi:MAG: hypothetical protein RL538_551 [Candidatus Parcubacteria bacterium]|jgi:cell division protein FtsX
MQNTLHKKIMRRVYYSYAIRFVTEPMLWQGMVLGVCVALFGRLTHVAAIARNLEATSVGNAPQFILNSFLNALTHGEVFTVLVTLAMILLSISFARQFGGVLQSLRSPRFA